MHVALLAVTALVAALYPMRIVAAAADRRDAARRGGVVMAAPVDRARRSRHAASFAMPAGPVIAVRDVSLDIAAGDHIAIRGPSGCGKSTLLHMLGCVDTPSSGTLLFEGRDVATLSDRERSLLRLRQIGFVFQRFFLLPMLTARGERRAAAVGGRRRRRATASARTRELLDYVGLAARADHRPSQLSGGEMQRVAIARALANRPRLLLADEPTGELDQATGEQIAALLDRVNARRHGAGHRHARPRAGRRAPRRVLTMRDGRDRKRDERDDRPAGAALADRASGAQRRAGGGLRRRRRGDGHPARRGRRSCSSRRSRRASSAAATW